MEKAGLGQRRIYISAHFRDYLPDRGLEALARPRLAAVANGFKKLTSTTEDALWNKGLEDPCDKVLRYIRGIVPQLHGPCLAVAATRTLEISGLMVTDIFRGD
jgi:hypothetical protein